MEVDRLSRGFGGMDLGSSQEELRNWRDRNAEFRLARLEDESHVWAVSHSNLEKAEPESRKTTRETRETSHTSWLSQNSFDNQRVTTFLFFDGKLQCAILELLTWRG